MFGLGTLLLASPLPPPPSPYSSVRHRSGLWAEKSWCQDEPRPDVCEQGERRGLEFIQQLGL